MTAWRDRVRQLVLSGGHLLRETAAGVTDAARELSDPRFGAQRLRERELAEAQQHGRWLSEQERGEVLQAERDRRQRQRTLVLLLVISVLVPLFWPLVPLWVGLLWFPRGTRWVLIALAMALVLLLVLLAVGLVLLIW